MESNVEVMQDSEHRRMFAARVVILLIGLQLLLVYVAIVYSLASNQEYIKLAFVWGIPALLWGYGPCRKNYALANKTSIAQLVFYPTILFLWWCLAICSVLHYSKKCTKSI